MTFGDRSPRADQTYASTSTDPHRPDLPVALGCGDDDSQSSQEGNGKVRTTEHGTRIITSVDDETGLRLEIQDDSLYLKLTDDTPPEVRDRIKGKGLAGKCEGSPGKVVPGLTEGFQVFWREQFGDWGSAVVRLPERKPPLADELATRRIYAPDPGSDQIRVGGSAKTDRRHQLALKRHRPSVRWRLECIDSLGANGCLSA